MNWDSACNYDREVSFQGRLDKTLERQKRKLNDNRIMLAGVPEDVIVCKEKRTKNGDKISRVIVDQKLVNIIFPVLKDLPVRKISTEFEKGYTLTSLVSAHGEGSEKGQGKPEKNLTQFDVLVPFYTDIDVDDIVVRVFVQEEVQHSTVMTFKVVETLSDYSNNAPLNLKLRLAIMTEPLDMTKEVWQLIVALSKRRLAAKY